MLFESGHCRALARQSAAEVGRTFAVMKNERVAYQARSHRLDPRGRRTVDFGIGLLLQAAIFAVLVALDAVEFSGVLAGWMTVAAVAAAATWDGFAWLASLAVRERERGLLAGIGAGAAGLGLLLTALHAWAPLDRHVSLRYELGTGLMAAGIIAALVVVSAVLALRTEPASLMPARRRWLRARSDYRAAVRTHRADAEADIVAGQAWYSLLATEASQRTASRERFEPTWAGNENGRPGRRSHP